MNNILISVIIPNHNYAQYLQQCLQSALDSDFDPDKLEIVVVDDASTDDSVRVIEQIMKDSRFPLRLIKNETNLGLILSRNRGIAHAHGEFLFFLDSDNYIRKDCIKTHVAAMKKNPEAIACYTPIQDFLNKTGEYCGLRSNQPFNYQQLLQVPYIDAMAMFRKSTLVETGMYDIKMPPYGWEDYELWLRLGKLNKQVIFIEGEPLSFYRTHPMNMSKNYKPDQYNHLVYYLRQNYPVKLIVKKTETLESFINYKKHIAQLYYQTEDACFNEQNSMKVEITENPFHFNLPVENTYTALRFDPVNDYAVVKLNSIKFNHGEVEICCNHKITSNAGEVENTTYYFAHSDPQITIGFEVPLKIDEVVIDVTYLKTDTEIVAELESRNKLKAEKVSQLTQANQTFDAQLSEKSKEMKKKAKEMNQKIQSSQNEIDRLNNQNAALSNELAAIKRSHNDKTGKLLRLIHPLQLAQRLKEKLRLPKNLRLIKESGLFDEAYYLENNPDVMRSGMPALKHYILFGGFEGRNPSKVFDGAYYLNENPDVKQNGYHPLLHYILHGSFEGRKPAPDYYPDNQQPGSGNRYLPFWPLRQKYNKMQVIAVSKPHFSPPVNDFSLEVPFKYPLVLIKPEPGIAVICHIFYLDILDEIKSHLTNIPYSFDLYVTTNTEEKRNFIIAAFSGWKYGKVQIKTFENRGRDIAPKLLSWPEVYEAYEYVLHIHTKKTLHEETLNNWRKYLYENLLGSEEIVKSILDAFSSEPKLGIVAPQHFQNVRHAIGWGYNFEIAEKFAEKIGIPISKNGPVDFPSGSMFWARTASIKPLLEHNFRLADFQEEAGQIDNTLAHVIERLYFFVCEKAGYKWIKIIHPSGEINTGRSISIERKEELQHIIGQIQFPLLADPAFTTFNSGSSNSISPLDLLSAEKTDQQKLPESSFLLKNESIQRKYYRKVWENSDYTFLNLDDFIGELKLHNAGKASTIDFDETFYLQVNTDVARMLSNGSFESGFVHFCLSGRKENRKWSNRHLTKKFNLQPNYPTGMFAPVKIGSHQKIEPLYKTLSKSKEPFMLILFGHLQSDLFYAGYNAFFGDFVPVFDQFSKIILSVESDIIEPGLATQYADKIEVINQKQLKTIQFMPDVIVGFSNHEVNKAMAMFNSPERLVYYCQEYEAGFYPFGTDFINAERAITIPGNIILSTGLLKNYLQKKKLLKNSNVFVTSPEIEVLSVNPEKSKKLFFYFRPEYFHTRNIPEILWETLHRFCETHTGFEIYMVGTIETRFSFEINHNPVFVLSKLPKTDYFDLITSCDVVVAMIYSAHPGVIAFQAAASGIPTVTNIFDNRDAATLKQISENIVPFDPVNDLLLDKIELALAMPKGKKSFDQELYSGKKEALTLSEYILKIWNH